MRMAFSRGRWFLKARKLSMMMTKRANWELTLLRSIKVQLSLVRRLKFHSLRLFTRLELNIVLDCLVP